MKIGIVAGEASGDYLGSLLIGAVKARFPNAEFVGIAGPRMISAGATSWYPMETLAVRGYVEVLKSLWTIMGMRRQLIKRFKADPPQFFIGIDAPDFNLALETELKRAGIPTLHYVSPSIWAWRGERIKKIGQAVSRMLTIFPFEAELYEKEGIAVSYVGHPMADKIADVRAVETAREQVRLSGFSPLIALLPGSRQSELSFHSELMIETAREVLKDYPNAHFLVPLASRETRNQFEEALYRQVAVHLPITAMFGHADLALQAADVALVASGTATLETALIKCPMVITYRISKLSYRIMWGKGYLPYIGLPNVMAGQFIVPELLQDSATPTNLARALVNLLRHPAIRDAQIEQFARLHASLKQNNRGRVLDALMPYLTKGPSVVEPAVPEHEPAYLRR